MKSLQELVKKSEAGLAELKEVVVVNMDSDAEDDLLDGKITARFVKDKSFSELTGYSGDQIANFVELMLPFAAQSRKRGPPPRSSLSDAVICYLLSMKTDVDAPALAKTLAIGDSQFIGNIDRIRSLLFHGLRSKWATLIPRPTDDDERPFPTVGLLIDVHTTECFRPKARFEESKIYYDGKNHIYGLKTEVAITAARPHFCVTTTPHEPGSVHDYSVHKKNYERYLDYLQKTAEERAATGGNGENAYWEVLVDKGYIGPASDTPHVKRITPVKKPNSTQAVKRNKDIGAGRVHIECFFGRLVKKFVLRKVYRFNHDKFDMDFANCCLLVNEDMWSLSW